MTNPTVDPEFTAASDLTVAEIQEILNTARNTVKDILDSQKVKTDSTYARILIVFTVLDEVQQNSNSLNDIPGLRGIGLEDTLRLAQQINAKKGVSATDLGVNYRLAANSITLQN